MTSPGARTARKASEASRDAAQPIPKCTPPNVVYFRSYLAYPRRRPFVNRTFALASIERTKIPYRIYRAFIASCPSPSRVSAQPLASAAPLSTPARRSSTSDSTGLSDAATPSRRVSPPPPRTSPMYVAIAATRSPRTAPTLRPSPACPPLSSRFHLRPRPHAHFPHPPTRRPRLRLRPLRDRTGDTACTRSSRRVWRTGSAAGVKTRGLGFARGQDSNRGRGRV